MIASGRVIGLMQRRLPDNTQHSKETDIHATGGIRTRNPSKHSSADPRFRPRGHWDPIIIIIVIIVIIPEKFHKTWCNRLHTLQFPICDNRNIKGKFFVKKSTTRLCSVSPCSPLTHETIKTPHSIFLFFVTKRQLLIKSLKWFEYNSKINRSPNHSYSTYQYITFYIPVYNILHTST